MADNKEVIEWMGGKSGVSLTGTGHHQYRMHPVNMKGMNAS